MRLLISLALFILFSWCRLPAAQEGTGDLAEARRLLVEASQLVKDLPEFQRSSTAANIAGQLVRANGLLGDTRYELQPLFRSRRMHIVHTHTAVLSAERLNLHAHSRQPFTLNHVDILRDVLLQISLYDGPQ